ncbi:HMG domain-containing protein 3-like isoform X2 [Sinocyclocheilus rhinocerous]|uniref:HMG domain-containing protein 3-like isoform X2 n=1 Tax=Sinocyclocheilus rhinocerous TaxID=307959 RepID=UPI0007BAB9C4|nr:PREDICTED: HMG domain-containing protein 3-like isoform X2 [Sinocyclocheilus rhinocerous]
MLHAYLQFEALTDHEYKYSCPTCGDYPPVVIMGVHKHTASPLSENDIEKPPGNFKGEVNLEEFWESLSKEMISRGFVANGGHNPFAVPPSYHFWAPWIGKNTRHSDTVLNTEFEKVHSSKSASEILEMTLTEERLREELFKQKDDVIRSLCNECGVDSTGSRSDLLLRLSDEMKSRQTYDKIYSKIWSATGGWGVIMCPCGIVYSLKCNLRAESHQDFADLLLSWHHMPNVIIYDFAQALSKHINLRAPEELPISPFEGRLVEPTQDNTELAKCGQLKVSLPWLDEKTRGTESDPHGHPVTGSSDHYVLCDRFHEGSTEDGDVLRKLTLVPQLADKVNSEIAEQLFAQMKKNDYFLNMSLPSTHLFQMRNIIHHYNENKANKLSTRSTKSFGSNLLTEAVLA